ncbi:MAG: O-antigen ligase family protein [Proteobacteria bacterium]|nr:O-antigen ligase family protein [Pseudomonadota bacterium]
MAGIIKKYSLKDVLQFLVVVLIGYLTAKALFNIMAEGTLGSIFRNMMPVFPCLFILLILNAFDIRRASFREISQSVFSIFIFDQKLISKRSILLLIPVMIAGIFFTLYSIEFSIINMLSFFALLYVFFLSVRYILLSEKKFYGVLIYILAIPLLSFIQWENVKYHWLDLIINDIYISYNAIGLVIIFICFLFGNRGSAMLSRKEKNFIKLCALFVLVPLTYILLSKDPMHSIVYYCMDLLLPFIFFIILMISMKNENDVIKLLFSIVICITIHQLLALYFLFQKEGLASVTGGLYGAEESNFSPALCLILIPVHIALMRRLSGWKRNSFFCALIFLIIFLILSNWRTGFFALLFGLFEYFLFFRANMIKKSYFILSGSFLTILITLIIVEYFYEIAFIHRALQTFVQIASGEGWDTILTQRASIWSAAFNMIADFPFFGIGPDMWSQYIPEYARSSYFYRDILGNLVRYYEHDPHNLYLLVYLNYGMLGFLFYILILYRTFRTGLSSMAKSMSGSERNIAEALIISLSMWAVSGLFTMRFFSNSDILFALLFWSIVAAILKLHIQSDYKTA